MVRTKLVHTDLDFLFLHNTCFLSPEQKIDSLKDLKDQYELYEYFDSTHTSIINVHPASWHISITLDLEGIM